MLQTMGAAYQTAQLNGNSLSACEAFYLATRGAAQALYLEDRIGSIAVGMEADLIVLNMKSTPLIEFRMQRLRKLRRGAVRADDDGGRPRRARHVRERRDPR